MNAQIAVLPGDGVGPEVVGQARRVLEAVAAKFGHHFEMEEAHIGGGAIDATGESLPAKTLALCRRADAILLGAVGGPQWDAPGTTVRPEQGLLALRQELELFANLRPVRVHPRLKDASPLKAALLEGIDVLVVRELTGGIYFGEKRRDGDRAIDTCVYTVGEVERIVRIACEQARKRAGRVTSVDKANVLETSRLWRATAERVGREEFPDVVMEHLLVDAAAMHLLRRPSDFDVIVTENMFGDILTDEASMLSGSLGMLPSASLGAGPLGLYEPIHGSAPDIAGTGRANPYGAILSVAMLLHHSFDLFQESATVQAAVATAIDAGYLTPDIACDGIETFSTAEIGDAVVANLGSATD